MNKDVSWDLYHSHVGEGAVHCRLKVPLKLRWMQDVSVKWNWV
jgi:hypothetical protein